MCSCTTQHASDHMFLATWFESACTMCLLELVRIMHAAPFHLFLGKSQFESEHHLMDRAITDKAPGDFVIWAVGLRRDSRTRRGWGDLVQRIQPRTMGSRQHRWCTILAERVFNLWRLMHLQCIPHAKRPTRNMGVLSHSQRRRWAQLAVCSYKAPGVNHNAAAVAARLWTLLFRSQYFLCLEKP